MLSVADTAAELAEHAARHDAHGYSQPNRAGVGTVAPAWGMDAGLSDAIVTTLNAIGTLMGAVLVVSAATAKPSEGDGE